LPFSFCGQPFIPLKKKKTIHQPSPLQKKKDETFKLHLIDIAAAVAAMQCSGSGAMSQGVGQLQCWLVGIQKLLQACTKNKTTINLCRIRACFFNPCQWQFQQHCLPHCES